MFKNQILIAGLALFVAACGTEKKETTTVDSTKIKDSLAKVPAVSVQVLWATDTVMKAPESVLYDKERNIIYVSNIKGKPTDKDKNGFISKLTPDGKIETLEWIKGLDAPKGLGLYKNKLYVTDLSKIVEIDIDKGAISKTYNVPGAKFLNDITVDTEGTVYFTDWETNKIHTLINGKLGVWADTGLNKPNGLLIESNRLLSASTGDMNFRSFDLATKMPTVIATEIGAGDGIAYFGKPGHYLVSDWNGTVFLIEPDGTKNIVLDTKANKINSADIDFIPETNTLLVPTFFDNRVVAYKVMHTEKK
jgi:sugar lactone lactonase YvrE